MEISQPFFSVIIPTYNREKLIQKTLNSVLNQKFQSFEIIVVDDGGQDNSEQRIRDIASPKICYYKKINGERGAARNYGWNLAKGTYVTFLDSDDIFYENHLQQAYDFIVKKNPVCFGQAYEIKNEETNKVLVKPYFSTTDTINDKIISKNILSCFGVFLKRTLIEEIRFDENRNFAGTEDWLLWLQLSARYPFYYNNVLTGALLEHNERSVLSFNEKSLLYRAKYLRLKLENDQVFINKYSRKTVNKIYAHMLSYASLHLAISSKRFKAFIYLIKAMAINVNELLSRRGLAITKKLLFFK
jgi:Glycosyltransferases involved in cell wall biogenesis